MPDAPAPISIYGGFAMVNNIVPIPGYVHLYRSMLRFYDMPSAELKEMLYLLNTANLDSYGFHHREALQMLRCVISNLEYRFYKAYNMEFEDKRTVYSECAFRLIPHEDEPSVCLMRDWVYLPTA